MAISAERGPIARYNQEVRHATLLVPLILLAGVAAATPAKKKPAPKKKHRHHAHAAAITKPAHASPTKPAPAKSSDDESEPPDPNAKLRFTAPPDATASAAYHYGTLDKPDCLAQLDARKISYVRETAAGVAKPVRLTGPLHGVTFHSDAPAKERATTPYEVADCSLVLALDDFAAQLAKHDVVEVVHYSMWRPPPKDWPADKIGTRHPGAVAIDVARFVKSDGTVLSVEDDFHGALGDLTCGDGAAPHLVTPASTEIRAILCDAAAARIFNVILTPNYNPPHHNHFHMEVTAGVKWFLLH